jgi:hypothetical protein
VLLRLLVLVIPVPSSHPRPLKKPKGLKKRKGSLAKVPVPLTVSLNGRKGRGWGLYPICLIPTATVSQGPNFPDLGKPLSSRRDTYIKGFRIVEVSIKAPISPDKEMVGSFALGTSGPWDRTTCLSVTEVSRADK